MQETEKTIVAKIRTDELTHTKREALNYEFRDDSETPLSTSESVGRAK